MTRVEPYLPDDTAGGSHPCLTPQKNSGLRNNQSILMEGIHGYLTILYYTTK